VEPPDRLEKHIRFGCGFLFGCVSAIGALLTSLVNAHTVAAGCVLAGLVCGWGALKFGDAFWDKVRRWWMWW
jgi:hypothetical protein